MNYPITTEHPEGVRDDHHLSRSQKLVSRLRSSVRPKGPKVYSRNKKLLVTKVSLQGKVQTPRLTRLNIAQEFDKTLAESTMHMGCSNQSFRSDIHLDSFDVFRDSLSWSSCQHSFLRSKQGKSQCWPARRKRTDRETDRQTDRMFQVFQEQATCSSCLY